MSLQLHRPDGRGGIEQRTGRDPEWRGSLLSARWGSRLPGRRLPALRNTEMNPTPTWLAVLFWASLAGLTFVMLLAGYGTGFWN